MEQWWPKVKPGGILAGHDYHPKWIATMNAVDGFVERHDLALQLTHPADELGADPYPSWLVEKTSHEHAQRVDGAQRSQSRVSNRVEGNEGKDDGGTQVNHEAEVRQVSAVAPNQSFEPRWRTDSPIAPGESVILVGNGPSMTLRGDRGAQIDAFDQVVRFNWYAIRGFEAMVGTKTTLWSTFGRGSRPRDEGEVPPRALYIHGDKPKRFEIPVGEAFGVARAFYNDVRERLTARSRRDETGKKPLLPSSGLVVLLWLQEFQGVGQVALAGFDHFSKKESGGHHYWLNQRFKEPPEHDGVAEAEWFEELAEAGKVRYLDRPDQKQPPVLARPEQIARLAPGRKTMPKKLILHNKQSPGDVLMLTAAIRDLHAHYPGQFLTDVRTPCPHLWENNPHLTPIDDQDPDGESIVCEYPLIHRSNQEPWHFLHAFGAFLAGKLGLPQVNPTAFQGDLHLSDEERGWISQVHEITGTDEPFWIVVNGGKKDFTAKWWSPARMQEVVDRFKDRVRFVQVGEQGHHHPPLNDVLDLRGKTDLRQLVRLVYHSSGVICPVTLLMHLAAAVPMRPDRRPPKNRPAVVIAGGREPPHWEAYPHHQFLHSVGTLPCCDDGGCWKSRTFPLGDGEPSDQSLCVDPVESSQLPRCLHEITSSDVMRAVGRFIRQ
jgi:ADP-heptose:LPS heptosyltransferase